MSMSEGRDATYAEYESRTPLGWPVVPDVKMTIRVSAGPSARANENVALAAGPRAARAARSPAASTVSRGNSRRARRWDRACDAELLPLR